MYEKELKTHFLSFVPFLTLISFVSFINILARVVFSPLTPYICDEMNLCHSDTGNLFFILSIGFALTLFASQFVSSYISHKKTVILSVFTTGLSLILVSRSIHFDFLRLSLFCLGLSSGLFIPSAVSMIREVVGMNHIGKAFGVFGAAQGFAFILGPLIVQNFIQVTSWNRMLFILGLGSVFISFTLAIFLKTGDQKGKIVTLDFAKTIFSLPAFWILAILLCLANGVNYGIYNMAPDYFQRHNLLNGDAVNQLMIVARIGSILSAILGGVLADRFGLKRSIVAFLILSGAATVMMGLISPSFSLALFCIQTPLAACLMPLIHSAMTLIAPPEKNAAIVSMMAPIAFTIGTGVVPQFLGFLGDSQLYALGFILLGLSTLGSGLLFNLKAINSQLEMSPKASLES